MRILNKKIRIVNSAQVNGLDRDVKERIADIIGKENITDEEIELKTYSYDASLSRAMPIAVIHLNDIENISPVVKILYENDIPYTARAAGTNLCGAAVNLKGGVILNLSRLNKIHQIDTDKRLAVVEPGLVNLKLQEELEKFGFFYPPDPASQKVSTIGGNIAQNAGGPLCLKYGVTANNVVKLEVIMPDGTEKKFSIYDNGPDISGLICQSEGTLGIVKKAWLKILPIPKFTKTISACFENIEDSMNSVIDIVKSGILPRAVEEIDRMSIDSANENLKLDIPNKTDSLLIIELDSNSKEEIESQYKEIENILKNNKALTINSASKKEEIEKLWKIRKESYPALARISPNVFVEDGCVPRPKLVEAVKGIKEILNLYKLKAGLIFHAGDGNIHPNIIFDERDLEETKRVKKAGEEILKLCIKLGGTISGEHGIGVEKRKAMNWLYNMETLNLFSNIKKEIDIKNLLNPDKKIPISHGQIQKIERQEIPLSDNAKKILMELKVRYNTKQKTQISQSNKEPQKNNLQILSSQSLNRILDLDRDNMTITLESGVKIKDLKNILKKDGFDIELPENENDTLGSIIATKKYINLKDLIISMDLSLYNGDLIRYGSKAIKDVSGYNIVRLILGSMGAFAFILSATLKIKSSKNNACDKIEKFEIKTDNIFYDETILQIKKAFDPENYLNPWILENYEQISNK